MTHPLQEKKKSSLLGIKNLYPLGSRNSFRRMRRMLFPFFLGDEKCRVFHFLNSLPALSHPSSRLPTLPPAFGKSCPGTGHTVGAWHASASGKPCRRKAMRDLGVLPSYVTRRWDRRGEERMAPLHVRPSFVFKI